MSATRSPTLTGQPPSHWPTRLSAPSPTKASNGQTTRLGRQTNARRLPARARPASQAAADKGGNILTTPTPTQSPPDVGSFHSDHQDNGPPDAAWLLAPNSNTR